MPKKAFNYMSNMKRPYSVVSCTVSQTVPAVNSHMQNFLIHSQEDLDTQKILLEGLSHLLG